MTPETIDPQDAKALLAPFRSQIDKIDDAIVDLLAQRMGVVRQVAVLKARHGIPVVLPERVEQVISRNAERGAGLGLDTGLTGDLYRRIIAAACAAEEEFIPKS